MDDLVKRLREVEDDPDLMHNDVTCYHVAKEAADRIEQLERELADALGLIAKINDDIRDTEDAYRTEVDFADHLKSQLDAEKALADNQNEVLKKAEDALHDDGCRSTMWPRPQIALARAAYRKARGL